MRFLVFGATGTVGSCLVRRLVTGDHHVRVLTRDPEKALLLGPGIEIVRGDLQDPATLRSLFHGVDGAFLLNALSQTEASEGLMAVSAAMDSGLPRLVYLSVLHVDAAPYLPHFGSKVAVEAAVRASGIPWTILRPGHFFQNDYALKQPLLRDHVYPQPLGDVGVSRVDVRDIAELAAITLTQSGHDAKIYNVVGPRPLTGSEVAAMWSAALGHAIAYGGNDLDAWEAAMLRFMPAWLAYDLKLMFRHFGTHGLKGSDADVATMTRVLGHTPRSLEAFIEETATAWSAR